MVQWDKLNVVVLGLGKSGVSVAKCLHHLGAHVIANDFQVDCPYATELEGLGISVLCGHHSDEIITESTDYVVKSPGVPYEIAPIQKALALTIPVITEVEVAGTLIDVPMIGITGTNGKTTTTTWVTDMLSKGGLNPVAAGNIGTALTQVIQELRNKQYVVAELSSFQLKGIQQFHPHVAALLNVEEAHLDYHQTFQDYVDSKKRLFMNQTNRDIAVLNADSSYCCELSKELRASIFWFSRFDEPKPGESGVYIKDNTIISCIDSKVSEILSVRDVSLRGSFNLENALAAVGISLAVHCPISAIKESLTTFSGVEHRLEYVTEKEGVSYYNDSKATNTQAAKMAIGTFHNPIIWLAGGLDRGTDIAGLIKAVKGRIKALITFGETQELFERCAKEEKMTIYRARGVEEAVQIAKKISQSGDVVLLSPGCASWDMYASFEERGSIFKQAVHNL